MANLLCVNVFLAFIIISVSSVASAAGEKEFHCEAEGIFPDPDDCRSFYQCVYDAPPYHNTCDEPLLFHSEYLICDFPDDVDCGSRPIPGMTIEKMEQKTIL